MAKAKKKKGKKEDPTSRQSIFLIVALLIAVALGGKVLAELLLHKLSPAPFTEADVNELVKQFNGSLPITNGDIRTDNAQFVGRILQINHTVLGRRKDEIDNKGFRLSAQTRAKSAWCKLLSGPQEIVRVVMSDFTTDRGEFLDSVVITKKDCGS